MEFPDMSLFPLAVATLMKDAFRRYTAARLYDEILYCNPYYNYEYPTQFCVLGRLFGTVYPT